MHYCISNFQTHQCWLIASSFNWRWSSSVVVFGIVFRYTTRSVVLFRSTEETKQISHLDLHWPWSKRRSQSTSPVVSCCFSWGASKGWAWWILQGCQLRLCDESGRLCTACQTWAAFGGIWRQPQQRPQWRPTTKHLGWLMAALPVPIQKKEEKEGQKNLRNSSSIN